jgi:Rrf2 family protein
MVITRCGFVYFSLKLDLYQKEGESRAKVCFNIHTQIRHTAMKIPGKIERSATIAMVDLANRQGKEGRVSLADIATLQHKCPSYLEPIFKKLKAAGLVESRKGPGGGYRTKDIKKVTVSDIVIAITGDVSDPNPSWDIITRLLRNDLSKVTLFDLTR